MVRKAGMAFIGMFALVLVLGSAVADEKGPTIKQVMKATTGKNGLCAKCSTAAKGEKWEDAQKLAKELSACGEALTKTKCPKGDGSSWAKLTKQFSEQTKAIAKAADDKDSKAFGGAVKAFTGSCKGCHDAHK